MTLLISAHLLDDTLVYKAPIRMMYFIETITVAVIGTIVGYIVVQDTLNERFADTLVGQRDIIAAFSGGSLDDQPTVSGINHKSKFLSVGKTSSAAMDARILIYGELVPATTTELILEWFRKGR